MKKLTKIFVCFFACLLVAACTPKQHICEHVCPTCGYCLDEDCTDPVCAKKCVCVEPTVKGRHLIVDQYGDFGGNLDKAKYGEGAPLNGKYDVLDKDGKCASDYYSANDWYNIESTETRTLIQKFAPYQQTMADTDGIACAVSIFNHEGKNVQRTYSEENLVKKMESITGKPVYENGTTNVELGQLFEAYGYFTTAYDGKRSPSTYAEFADFVEAKLKDNYYVMVRYQDGERYQWHLIIGIETFGDTNTSNDVLIFMDPFDACDHFQDGYSIYHLTRMYHWFMKRNKDCSNGTEKEILIIKSEKAFDFGKNTARDVLHTNEPVPENHLYHNADGTVGGYYGDGRYSGASAGKPGVDPSDLHNLGMIEYSYYKQPDYFNMEDTETRNICTNYRAFIQTCSSTCGICSCMSVLNYYSHTATGEAIPSQVDWSKIGEYVDKGKRTDWYGYDATTNNKFGGTTDDEMDRRQEAIMFIFMQGDSNFSGAPSTKFYNYGGVGASKLSKVPTALGFPNVKYGNYSSGSFKSAPFPTIESFKDWAIGHLKDDEPCVISWNPTGGHWEVIIAYDDMGTPDFIWDDVVVLADSSDGVDHYKDGYNTLPAHVFYGTWYNGSASLGQAFVTFSRKAG